MLLIIACLLSAMGGAVIATCFMACFIVGAKADKDMEEGFKKHCEKNSL